MGWIPKFASYLIRVVRWTNGTIGNDPLPFIYQGIERDPNLSSPMLVCCDPTEFIPSEVEHRNQEVNAL